jgi:hypothetical protein
MATHNVPTLTIVSSNCAVGPDGRVTLVLETKERGPVAFDLTLQADAESGRSVLVGVERAEGHSHDYVRLLLEAELGN